MHFAPFLMRKLIFIRHAMVEVESERPSHTWTLSDDGRSACKQLAAKLTPYHPDIIICSEEPKAHETGEIIAAVLGIPCRTAPGLHEHLRYTMPFFDTKAEFETAVARFFAHPDQLVLGEETADAAYVRFATAVDAVLAAHPHQTVAIVTHGTVLTLYASRRNPQIDPFSFWRQLQLPDLVVVSAED